MNDHIFGCPKCSREFKVLAEFAGEVVQCPHCSQQMRIPAALLAEELTEKPKTTSPSTPKQTSLSSGQSAKHVSLPAGSAEGKTPRDVVQETAVKAKPEPDRKEKGFDKQSTRLPAKAEPTEGKKLSTRADNKRTNPDSTPSRTNNSLNFSSKQAGGPKTTQAQTNLAAKESEAATTELGLSPSSVLPSSDNLPLPPVFEVGTTDKLASSEVGYTEVGVGEPSPTRLQSVTANETAPAQIATATETLNVDRLLPQAFVTFDPARLRRQSDGANQILLPTADGGVQSVHERSVTIEYKGKKYTVIAATPEEKRRRQIFVNFVSIIVAITAIVGTIWILLN
jgi:hypothetical protein